MVPGRVDAQLELAQHRAYTGAALRIGGYVSSLRSAIGTVKDPDGDEVAAAVAPAGVPAQLRPAALDEGTRRRRARPRESADRYEPLANVGAGRSHRARAPLPRSLTAPRVPIAQAHAVSEPVMTRSDAHRGCCPTAHAKGVDVELGGDRAGHCHWTDVLQPARD